MKLLATVFYTLLGLANVSSVHGSLLNLTAEDFMDMDVLTIYPDEIHHLEGHELIHNISKRQTTCGTCTLSSYTYQKVGNGSPHQNYVIIQKGGTLASCTNRLVSTGTGFSSSVGWSISGGIGIGFINGGFGVSESVTYSVQSPFTCDGVAAEGGDLCVIFYHGITAFTVNVVEHWECPCDYHIEDLGTAIVYAPNTNKAGSIAWRGINVQQHGVVQCQGNANRRINYHCGPPGGPAWWAGKSAGPWNPHYVANRQPAGCAIPIEARKYTD